MRTLTIKVKRANGSIEEVDASLKFPVMSAPIWAKVQLHMAASGQEALSYEETLTDSRSAREIRQDAADTLRDEANKVQARGGVSSAIAAHMEADRAQAAV